MKLLQALKNMMTDALELPVNRKSRKMQADNKSTHKLVLRNPEFITQLDAQEHSPENEHKKAGVG